VKKATCRKAGTENWSLFKRILSFRNLLHRFLYYKDLSNPHLGFPSLLWDPNLQSHTSAWHTTISFPSTSAPHCLAIGRALWMAGPGRWEPCRVAPRQRRRKARAAPPLPRQTDHGPRRWSGRSPERCRKGRWLSEGHCCCVKPLRLGAGLLPHAPYVTTPRPSLTWENKLTGPPRAPKVHLKFSALFHLNPKPTSLPFWLTSRNLRFCCPPLHPQAWVKKLHRSSLINFYWRWWKS